MEKKQKKQIPTTVKNYRKWQAGHYALQGGEYVAAIAPEAIMTIVNWNEWSAQCGNKYSLGLGFTTALIGVASTILAIAKKQQIFKNKLSSLVAVSIIIAIFSISCLFLSKLLVEFGYMLMCIAGGLLTAAGLETVDTQVVEPTAKEYKKLYDENGFNRRLTRKNEAKAERERLAKQEAKIRM